MELLSSLSYSGQDLAFVDTERFAHLTNKGLYLYDAQKGPREVLWRPDRELTSWAVNPETSLVYLSFGNTAISTTSTTMTSSPLEVVRLTDINTPIHHVTVPVSAPIQELSLSKGGSRLYGLSGVGDHQLCVWRTGEDSTDSGQTIASVVGMASGIVTGSRSVGQAQSGSRNSIGGPMGGANGQPTVSTDPRLLATRRLETQCRRVVIDPSDANRVAVFGNDCVYIATVTEIFDEYSLKLQQVLPALPPVSTEKLSSSKSTVSGGRVGEEKSLTSESLVTATPRTGTNQKGRRAKSANPLNGGRSQASTSDTTTVNDVSSDLLTSGSSVLEIEPLGADITVVGAIPGGNLESDLCAAVQFVMWLPYGRLLVALADTTCFMYDIETKKRITVGGFMGHDLSSTTLPTGNAGAGGSTIQLTTSANLRLQPMCAILTAQYLVVGMKDDRAVWYPAASFIAETLSEEDLVADASTPLRQVATSSGSVLSLVMDSTYAVVVIGTSGGKLLRVPMDIEAPAAEEKEEDHIGLAIAVPTIPDPNTIAADGNSITAGRPLRYEVLEPTDIGNDSVGGVVLCSQFLTLGVKKMSSRSKSIVSGLVTGSTNGTLVLWRHVTSSAMGDMMLTSAGTGLRRSVPRVMKELMRLPLGAGGAITSIEFIAIVPSVVIMAIGRLDGRVDFWQFIASENEEDDTREVTCEVEGQAVRMIEDDEGSIMVRVEARLLLRTQVFESSAVSAIAVVTRGASDMKLALASDGENRLYFMTVTRGGRVDLASKAYSVDVPPEVGGLHTLSLGDSHIFGYGSGTETLRVPLDLVFGLDGLKPTEIHTLPPVETLPMESLSPIMRIVISTGRPAALVVTDSGALHYLTFPEDPVARASWQGVKSKRLNDPRDLVTNVTFSSNGSLFAVGTLSGTVYIYKVDGDSAFDVFLVHSVELFNGAVLSLCFGESGTCLFAASLDGACHLLSLGKLPNKIPAAATTAIGAAVLPTPAVVTDGVDDMEGVELTATGSDVPLGVRLNLEREKSLKAQFKFKSMGIAAAAGELQQRLQVLISQNDARDADEKLEPEDLVVDENEWRRLQDENQDAVDTLRQSYRDREAYLELLAARLRVRTYDQNRVTGSLLRHFHIPGELEAMHKQSCMSLSIPRFTKKESLAIDRLKRLRRLELRAMRQAGPGTMRRVPTTNQTVNFRAAWIPNLSGVPVSINYILNDGVQWPLNKYEPTEDTPATAATSGAPTNPAPKTAPAQPVNGAVDGGEDGDVIADDATVSSYDDEAEFVNPDGSPVEIDLTDATNLVYPPIAARSAIQKRNQTWLIREVIHRMKELFNTQHTNLYTEKVDLIATITTKNDRIREILTELQSSERVWQPVLADDETVQNVLRVSPNEMLSRPYESDALKKKRADEEELRRLRELDNEDGAIKARALQEMMHGTLEVKRDVLAEVLLASRPAWYDDYKAGNYNEQLTDAEARELEVYEVKVAAFEEEQIHYRKLLEQELKRLRIEVVDVCRVFNDKVDAIGRDKLVVQKAILSQELYISSIASSLIAADTLRLKISKMEDTHRALLKTHSDQTATLLRYKAKIENLAAKRAAVVTVAEGQVRSFKKDFTTVCPTPILDQEELKILTELFLRRTMPRNSAGHAGTGTGDYDQSSDVGDNSASHSASTSMAGMRSRRGKDSSRSTASSKLASSQSKRAGSSRASTKSKFRASRGVSGANASDASGRDGSSSMMGPMQAAAQALRNLENEHTQAALIREKDPFFPVREARDRVRRIVESQFPLMVEQSQETDAPEGLKLNGHQWAELQKLRLANIEKTIETKLMAIEISEAESKVAVLREEEQIQAARIREIENARVTHVRRIKSLSTDLDVCVHLKQGQDEVDKDAAVTDYSQALLLPVDVIGRFNERILELGAEKIAILTKIKLFRRKINAISWEAQHQALQANHYENYYTDLQLFRVTRDLQKVIIEGANAFNQKERVEKLTQRKDHLIKDQNNKHYRLSEKLRHFERQLIEKDAEMRQLEAKILELQQQVENSESIKRSRDGTTMMGTIDNSPAAEKMRRVVGRRKMVDLAKAQAEEIDYLRQELDRMRQKTFPSFVKATQKRINQEF